MKSIRNQYVYLLVALLLSVGVFRVLQPRYHFELIDGLMLFTFTLYSLYSILLQ